MSASRLTYHRKTNQTAWQKLIRQRVSNEEGLSGWWSKADLSLRSAKVRECDVQTAKNIILKYEWLGTMPPAVRFSTGLFFDNWACGGVAVFGAGAGVNTKQMLGVPDSDIAYLARGACSHWTPQGSASKLIGQTLKIVAKKGYKVAIAYADTDAGEIGTVYQATNWLCIGRGSSTTQLIHPDTGRVYDMKTTGNIKKQLKNALSWSEIHAHLLASGFKEQKTNPKWRYIYILDKGEIGQSIYKRIQHLIVPYPKRQKDSSEPSTILVEEGGAAPTLTLQ
jgi:hypothetical protein